MSDQWSYIVPAYGVSLIALACLIGGVIVRGRRVRRALKAMERESPAPAPTVGRAAKGANVDEGQTENS